MRCKSLILNGLAALSLVGIVHAGPQPAEAPKSWELNFRFQDLQRIAVTLPGRSEPATYWYLLYSVENRTGKAQEFYPTFEIVTDTLNVVESEIGVSPEAFRAIQRRWKNPLLLEGSRINGTLLAGEDRAKQGVAIWPDFDPKAKDFKVYVSGLSGETTKVANPAFDPAKPEEGRNKRFFLLRKTLEIPYRLPGGPDARHLAVPERLKEEPVWVMR